jgi:hypothetical protein
VKSNDIDIEKRISVIESKFNSFYALFNDRLRALEIDNKILKEDNERMK